MAQLASAGSVPLCQNCSQPITRRIRKSRDSGRCCSRACGFEMMRRERSASRSARLTLLAESRKASRQRQCLHCGGQFEAQASAKYCSYNCSVRSKAEEKAECACQECGSKFRPDYGDKRRNFCSEFCSSRHFKRIAKGIARAKSYGADAEPINPIAIMERDAWTCHICGVEAPRELRGTMRWNAPELDHIIPLAAGGSHTYDNVACAHRACNLEKGDALPVGSADPHRFWVHQGMGGIAEFGPSRRESALGPKFTQPRNSNRGSESRKSQISVELTG